MLATNFKTIGIVILLIIFNIFVHNIQQVSCRVAVADPDGEPMWGHIYISGGVVSYEFFRAKFGGKYNCNLDGFEVADLGIGCELLEDTSNIKGKIALMTRGNCSFNDKAIVAEKAGAVAAVVANNAPGLIRMPPGVIKMKKDYDVSIPVVMVRQSDGDALKDIVSRNPTETKVRVVGEVVVKGVTTIAGTCAEQVEVDADGNVKGLPEPEKEIEGGLIQLEESNGYTHEFLTAMFGGPIPKTAQKYAIADPYTACDELKNGEDMKGKFAIVQRGDCLFANKAHNAEKAGAIGVLVVNTDISLSRMFGGDSKSNFVTIPVVMVSKEAGKILEKNKADGSVKLQPNGIQANSWDQAVRFARQSNWPEDDEKREELWEKLSAKHDPNQSERGGPERFALLKDAYEKANEYYAETSAVF